MVRTNYCSLSHAQPCTDCYHMLRVAMIILEQNFCKLRKAFEIVSPTVKYSAKRAITKLLQMPLVSVRIGRPSSGMSFTILLEMFAGTDYLKLGMLLNQMAEMPMEGPGSSQNMERSFVKMLLNLAQSPRERECLRVAIVKASGISASKARRDYGFEKMDERTAIVEHCINGSTKDQRSSGRSCSDPRQGFDGSVWNC